MAFWFSRSRNISKHLCRKIGFLSEDLSHQVSFFSVKSDKFKNPPGFCSEVATLFSSRRLASIQPQKQEDLPQNEMERQPNSPKGGVRPFLPKSSAMFLDQTEFRCTRTLDFPGGKIRFTSDMRFISKSPTERIPCYQVLDDNGYLIMGDNIEQVSKEEAVKMYINMVTLQTMDTIFYEVQRQGRISFYLTSIGEEAINIASAAALTLDDVVLPQYREPGILLWRGFTLQEFANQCFGNKADYGKGRQMPIHYGSNKLNYFTISSPIATQIPQAVGVAYSLKMDKKDACVITFFGDGGTSEGDFHAGLNFAAVMDAPVIFFCRNNGWAISTPISEQFRSDGVVAKGQAYGIQSIRIDGNDALAVYNTVRVAREIAISQQRPILIEALTYRAGHHSTSDDSTKYRPADEIEHWRTARSPVARFRKWVDRNGWWTEKNESDLRDNVKEQLMQAIHIAEKEVKPPLSNLFTDVYESVPLNLREQEESLRETIQRYPQDYRVNNVPLL